MNKMRLLKKLLRGSFRFLADYPEVLAILTAVYIYTHNNNNKVVSKVKLPKRKSLTSILPLTLYTIAEEEASSETRAVGGAINERKTKQKK